jgi:hypothetical protein
MSSYGAKGTRTPNNRLQRLSAARPAAEPELRRREKRVAHLSLGQGGMSMPSDFFSEAQLQSLQECWQAITDPYSMVCS